MSNAYIDKALAENCLPSTLLFLGKGAKASAQELAAKLLGSSPEHHPDFHLLQPEGKSQLHLIESIRDAIEQSHESPYQGKASVFLIEAAERMQPASANALLKTLEEPAKESTWILVTDRPQDLLPTIVSRCTRVECHDTAQAHAAREEELLLQTVLKERPSYPKLSLELEKIEKLIQGEEYSQKAFGLLAVVSEHMYQQGVDNPDLSMQGEAGLYKAMSALERNIKLSTSLEVLLLKY